MTNKMTPVVQTPWQDIKPKQFKTIPSPALWGPPHNEYPYSAEVLKRYLPMVAQLIKDTETSNPETADINKWIFGNYLAGLTDEKDRQELYNELKDNDLLWTDINCF